MDSRDTPPKGAASPWLDSTKPVELMKSSSAAPASPCLSASADDFSVPIFALKKPMHFNKSELGTEIEREREGKEDDAPNLTRKAEIESEGNGKEDYMMTIGRKMKGAVEAPHDIENPKDPLPEESRNRLRLYPTISDERLRQGNGRAYTKMGGIDEASHDIENPKDPLLKELHNLFRLSPSRCIYRVPERLRQGNEKAYTPQVVSIGPLHHGKEHLKAMEEHKKRYLGDFLSRTREGVSFSDYIKMIKDQEGRLRGCYAEPIKFGSDEFVRIVLVDAAFVIEFLMRFYSSEYRQDEDDYMFNTPEMFWDVRPDLRLLENQLPFFILQDLFKIRCPSHQLPLLLNISYKCFESEIDSKGKEEKFKQICSFGDVKHFVDLLRILYLPLESKKKPEEKNTTPTPNVTELHQAGVKFVVGTGSDLFDIKFSSGKLEIPKLTVNDTTDLTLRNLLAFEQCHHREENYLTNYVVLMMRLVKTPKDVDLLVEKEIIENWLGDTQKISTLLHDLGNGVMVSNHYYAPLCEELHNYCSNRHKYMANLRQNYFNTPWSTLSVVAGVILLILTFIQTVVSM